MARNHAMTDDGNVVWKLTPGTWLFLIAVIPFLAVIYREGIDKILINWIQTEEYSHGPLIPLISLFLIWQKKDRLERIPFHGSWGGFAVVCAGVLVYFLGDLSAITIITQYSLVITIAGVAYTFMGWQGLKEIWAAIFFLIFMIPLPAVIFQSLSQQLQLISSQLGVAVIRLFDISVYLEGNVIDLGTYKLQVIEACSGLRYLFPLMSLAFISAYFYKTALWKKVVVFLSSIPITVLMNSFRIGVIGVLVEYGGKSMAEGFLHYFEGWVVFMICIAILFGEMWLLLKVGNENRSLREVFGMEFPAATPADAVVRQRDIPRTYIFVFAVIIAATLLSLVTSKRVEVSPARQDFVSYPTQLGTWQGRRGSLDQIYLDWLKLDDYLLVDYTDGKNDWVNLYMAYYNSQRKGHSIHSPRACIPGGGWEIKSLTQVALQEVVAGSAPLTVNRVVIQKGDAKQLVYYWFKQRNRYVTNEYVVKWYLFWDALTRNRTDGGLIRLTTAVGPAEDIQMADKRLTVFAKMISASLPRYVPD